MDPLDYPNQVATKIQQLNPKLKPITINLRDSKFQKAKGNLAISTFGPLEYMFFFAKSFNVDTFSTICQVMCTDSNFYYYTQDVRLHVVIINSSVYGHINNDFDKLFESWLSKTIKIGMFDIAGKSIFMDAT